MAILLCMMLAIAMATLLMALTQVWLHVSMLAACAFKLLREVHTAASPNRKRCGGAHYGEKSCTR